MVFKWIKTQISSNQSIRHGQICVSPLALIWVCEEQEYWLGTSSNIWSSNWIANTKHVHFQTYFFLFHISTTSCKIYAKLRICTMTSSTQFTYLQDAEVNAFSIITLKWLMLCCYKLSSIKYYHTKVWITPYLCWSFRAVDVEKFLLLRILQGDFRHDIVFQQLISNCLDFSEEIQNACTRPRSLTQVIIQAMQQNSHWPFTKCLLSCLEVSALHTVLNSITHTYITFSANGMETNLRTYNTQQFFKTSL